MALRRKSMVRAAEQQLVHETTDVLRPLVRQLLQEALETEFAQFLGAHPHERTATRRGWRNGTRARRYTTRVGRLDLQVPRDRAGLFQPALFARYERSEQALVAALVDMYVQGVSTRKVTKVVETLCGTSVSASTVSRVVAGLDGELAQWRTRDLGGSAYPYLVLDAHVEQVRREGQVRATAMLWVIGIRPDGYREHLGVWLGASESLESWTAVFEDLVARGLQGVTYAVSDEHAGLVAALRRFFPDATHQRCQVHYVRNALSRLSSQRQQEQLLTALHDVWAAPTRAHADARAARLIALVRPKAPALAAWLEDTLEATLACYVLSDGRTRQKLRSTNSIELDHAAVRRRTRVIRIFPNPASLLRLGSALAMERNEAWSLRRYLFPERPTIIYVHNGRPHYRRSA